MSYKGWVELPLTDSELSDYYQGKFSVKDYVNLNENQYCIIQHQNQYLMSEIWKKKNGQLVKVNYQTVGSDTTSSKAKPRNPQQLMEFDLLNDPDIGVKLVTGRWGSFKTGAFARAALDELDKQNFNKIILIRNNVQTKDTDQIGALPGDLWSKLLPFVGPFIDAVGDEDYVKDLVDRKQIEVVALGFLRGRNFENSIIIVDEAENLTIEHLQLIIARAASGSQIWIDGDCRQRDRAVFEKSKGIETMIEKLTGNKLFGYVHLIKTERSEVAALADLLKDEVIV